MDKYYYLVAQLPFLQFDKKPKVARLEFLQEAKKWLNSRNFINLVRASIDDFTPHIQDPGILKIYKNFEKTLKEELASIRKASKEAHDFKAFEIVKARVLEGNPLEVEKKLLKLRWDFIETQEKEHYFDLEAVVLYFLKLQILERLFSFDKEKGLEVFDSLCEVKQ